MDPYCVSARWQGWIHFQNAVESEPLCWVSLSTVLHDAHDSFVANAVDEREIFSEPFCVVVVVVDDERDKQSPFLPLAV